MPGPWRGRKGSLFAESFPLSEIKGDQSGQGLTGNFRNSGNTPPIRCCEDVKIDSQRIPWSPDPYKDEAPS